MPRVSVAICCYNSKQTLEAACQSVAWADELVVVDSGSSDGTLEVARRYADRCTVESWRGFTEQKKYAAGLCRNEWVLVLDSDEECSPELASEIEQLTREDLQRHDVFHMPRRNYILGRHVRSWDPDFQSRLIHRDRCCWREEALHDARLPSHPKRQRRLRGWIEHRRHEQVKFSAYFNGALADQRIALVARDLYSRGRRCRWYDLTLRPLGAFMKFYFVKGGMRDGLFGLLIAQQAAFSVRLKYAALWAIQQGVSVGNASGGNALGGSERG